MTTSADVASGKTHTDENFPVASHLIAARHRPAIMAFYHFVRAADDVADHATLTPDQKIALLDAMEASLLGRTDSEAVALPLRRVLAERRLSPKHAQELLAAFRLDVVKSRTANWAELIHYCSLSAMPVGRFVLDVHGESETTWPASDAICAALQIINHLQDCGKDYRDLDRVYIPQDMLAAAGLRDDALAKPPASAALMGCFRDLAVRTDALLDEGDPLPRMIGDFRLSMEIASIAALARRLTTILKTHDPLSQKVHLGKSAMLGVAMAGCASVAVKRWTGGSIKPTTRPGVQRS
ncbi:squalene synthase HpnC [Lichenihabitans psoromatis]|uniref:squalene synthase HpnC n=1 Tax=Lichenihabitans psoromatis TaxID=2528642 RepID=UPI00103845BF|nr:squalene synthase HpnC [Lichenihabitans psoromatis]